MTTIVIAEKAKMADKIRAGLGSTHFKIMSASGHLLELASPDDYLPSTPVNDKGKKVWRAEDLPIIPTAWKVEAKKEPRAASLLRDLLSALKTADVVIHAGDPDRAGQKIVDAILERANFKGKVERVWLKSLSPKGVQEAFADLKPNSEYISLSDSEDCRAKADWLVGMNLTRAWTIQNRKLMSIGRVQTPLLGIIVQRHNDILNFSPSDYMIINALVAGIKATYTESREGLFNPSWFDLSGRFVDKAAAERIADQITGKPAIVESFNQDEVSTEPPMPFDLKALQKAAGNKLGLTSQQTLDIAQSLYEDELITYARSECAYLPEDQISEAPDVLKAVRSSGVIPSGALPLIKDKLIHKAWDSSKVGAHHGIIPTSTPPKGLTGNHAALYEMIALSYAGLFMPSAVDNRQSVRFNIEGHNFVAYGKSPVSQGWRALYGQDNEQDDEDGEPKSGLPVISNGQSLVCSKGSATATKTKPPKPFTDATIMDAMASVHLFVRDPKARATLKETSGLGTSATRGNIIETLVKREFIERKGAGKRKVYGPTALGISLIEALGDDNPIVKPETTAQWEDALADIADGKVKPEDFIYQVESFVKESITKAKSVGGSSSPDRPRLPCSVPGCDGHIARLPSKKTKGVFFWACDKKDANGERVHPLIADDNGKPGAMFGAPTQRVEIEQSGSEPTCPKCKKPVIRRLTSTGKTYFKCTSCNTSWWPDFNNKDALGKKWDK